MTRIKDITISRWRGRQLCPPVKLCHLIASLLAVTLLVCGTSSPAVTVLSETFDYVDDAALDAVWNASSDNPDYGLDTSFGNPQPSYSMPSPSANFQGRLARNLPGGSIQATDANPVKLCFDFYLDTAGLATSWNGARHYVELRGYENGAFGDGGLQNLLAMGVFNSSDDDFDTTFYQGRVVFGSNWNTLDEETGAANRDVGWHTMQVVVDSSEVRFLVDGVLAEVEARPNNFEFDSVVLGSDLTANDHGSWVDNLSVKVAPEPSTLMLLAVAGLVVIGLRRRR